MTAVFLGYVLIFIIYKIPFKWLVHLNLPLFGLSLFLLMLVFIPGMYSKVGGALRWLNIGGIRIQPGEIAKVSMVFFLSKNLSRKGNSIHKFKEGLMPNFIVLGLFSALLLRQPDFGTTALLTLITFLMLYAAGISRKFLIITCSVGLISLAFAVITAPYRLKRVLTFLDPWANVQKEGFQIVQSFLAFRNGGFLGVGLGYSKQKLFFLPEAHTDFILSVIAEESGFLGTSFVCLSFLIMIICGGYIAFNSKERHKQFLAFGLTCLIGIQSLFNIAVVMGMLPTKGITLPFLSSGLSSLLVFFFIVGVLARIGHETQRAKTHEHSNQQTSIITYS